MSAIPQQINGNTEADSQVNFAEVTKLLVNPKKRYTVNVPGIGLIEYRRLTLKERGRINNEALTIDPVTRKMNIDTDKSQRLTLLKAVTRPTMTAQDVDRLDPEIGDMIYSAVVSQGKKDFLELKNL